MKKLALITLACAASLGAFVPTLVAGSSAPANSFVREPVVVFTKQGPAAGGVLSSTFVLYQDGFATASVSANAATGSPPITFVGDVGVLKARSWFRELVRSGGNVLPDGEDPDPNAGGVFTLTMLEPATNSMSHTFSFGATDYAEVHESLRAIFLRLGFQRF